MTVNEWLDIWLRDYQIGVKDSTAYLYERQAKLYLRPVLGSIPLETLKAHTIQRLYNSLSQEHDGQLALSAKAIKNIHGVLHKALQQAVLLNYIRYNPTTACVLPKIVKKEIHPLTDQQTAQLLNLLSRSGINAEGIARLPAPIRALTDRAAALGSFCLSCCQ